MTGSRTQNRGRLGVIAFLGAALVALSLWSLTVGASGISLVDLWTAAQTPDAGTRESVILYDVRLPRLLAAIAAGAGFAVAGAIMQAVTGNPLADPGLLGVNSGAAFAVVLVLVLVAGPGSMALTWAGFAGAAVAALVVYGLGSVGRSGATPVKLVLAGVVISSFLGSLTVAMLLLDRSTMDEVRFWTAGSLRNRQLAQVLPVLPYLMAGLAGALIVSRQFTALSLGETVARGLGQNLVWWRLLSAALVVVLAGSAVALAGPIGFVGLVLPHIARLSLGPDYRWIIPACLLGGSAITLLADTLPRALFGRDIPVGVTLAVLGAPYFIHLARRRVGRAAAL